MKKIILSSILAVILLSSVFTMNYAFGADSSKCTGTALCITDKVTKIIDGDTLYTKNYKIRLSLVNSPEKNQIGFAEAKTFTSKLCPVGSTLLFDQDDKQKIDKFGRVLGKVFCSGKNLNSELLYNNHAKISKEYCSVSEFSGESWAQKYGCTTKSQETKSQIPKESQTHTSKDFDFDGIQDSSDICPTQPETKNGYQDTDGCPDTKPKQDSDSDGIQDDNDQCIYQKETVNGYQDYDGCPDTLPVVDSDGDGIYDNSDACVYSAENYNGYQDYDGCPDEVPKESQTPTTTENLCDPSYPDVCIPPYPPDLDCGEISYKNFRVVGSDPHGFDKDNDGIGCEK